MNPKRLATPFPRAVDIFGTPLAVRMVSFDGWRLGFEVTKDLIPYGELVVTWTPRADVQIIFPEAHPQQHLTVYLALRMATDYLHACHQDAFGDTLAENAVALVERARKEALHVG